MAKGGARAHSGPAPDPDALRRDRTTDQAGWTLLPAAGRRGRTPKWPLADPTGRERELWKAEWTRPQAVEWERNRLHLEVALYVRSVGVAEMADANAASRTLVKQQQEALGISLPGLQRNRWRIAEPETAAPAKRAAAKKASTARDRFSVVTGGRSDD